MIPIVLTRDVIVAHSGTHHSYMTAAAFEEACLLDKYITSYYHKQSSITDRLLTLTPSIRKVSQRRHCDLLDDCRVISIPYYEAIEKGLNRTIYRNQSRDKMVYWRDRMFSRHVANHYIKDSTRLVIGYPNASLEMLQKVRKQGGLAVVDLPIGHFKSAESILQEERELHPAFADSITYSQFDQRYRDRVDTEFATANTILVPSEFVRQTLIEQGITVDRIRKVPYGSWAEPIRKEDIQSSSRPQPLRIIYFGQITQRKGIKYLLDSLKTLREQGLEIKCTLIGKLFGTCRWLGAYENLFQHIPHISRSELRSYLISHDLFVFPTLFEGSAYVIPEALAHGLPIITTPNSGAECLREGFNGHFVPIRNSEAIVERLTEFHSDRDRLNEMKFNALESSRAVTWKRYREELIHWYQQLSRENSSGI
jgi:starch synthase